MKEVLEVVVLDLIAPIGLITSFLFIWFKTDFLYSYLKLINFDFREYEDQSIENPDYLLTEYLACKNQDKKLVFFIFKLLSCPFCLAAWACLCVSLLFSVKLLGVYYVVSLLTYRHLEKSFFND